MPRYIRVADVPAILREQQGVGNVSKPPYQLDAWQKKNCAFSLKEDGGGSWVSANPTYGSPERDVAVLSYRWRVRGRNESIEDFKQWLTDCSHRGYTPHSLKEGPLPVDWSLADGHSIQIEVAAWLLWLYTNRVAKYAWVDQMCVPQDADIEEKMQYIKESPAIYKAGRVHVMIAPVVDRATGRIMLCKDAESIVTRYLREMDVMRSNRRLSPCAATALLVNHSYMRRVWTIQEAVSAELLSVWPFQGRGDVGSYQSLRVMDWPDFNAWNGHPALGPLYLRFRDKALNDYYEGDYTGILGILRKGGPGAIGYLAMATKDLMWITEDRKGLVNDIKKARTAAHRAWVLLNNHQIQSARSFLPEDRVLALVPLVDYDGWRAATAGRPARELVQASVEWAYGLFEKEMATWKWSIRIYNAPACKALGLDQLQPRRNLSDSTAVHGATPGWQVQIPAAGGIFELSAAPPPPGGAAPPAAAARRLQLRVEFAAQMPHPGQARFWGGGPWTRIRDALQTDEVFRLSVQWALEPWRNPDTQASADRCAVVVALGSYVAVMLILAVPQARGAPRVGKVMMVVDISPKLLDALIKGLRKGSIGGLASPFTAVMEFKEADLQGGEESGGCGCFG